MIGKTLFQAVVIGILSTGLYMVFTNESSVHPDPRQRGNRTNECLCISGIVTTVAMILLLMTGSSEQLALKETSSVSAALNHKAPF
jgi:EamA domain-containing membrane protein RarD